MMRWVRRIVAGVSLLLLVAVVVLWIRSYFAGDCVIWSDGAERPRWSAYRMGHRWVFTLYRGEVWAAHDTSWHYPRQFRYVQVPRSVEYPPVGLWYTGGPLSTDRWLLGFREMKSVGTPPLSSIVGPAPMVLGRAWAVPMWAIAGALAILPGVQVAGMMRRRLRRRRGLCVGCGYDLRASAERCPECGRPVTDQRIGSGLPRT